jgi:hypothetical protein
VSSCTAGTTVAPDNITNPGDRSTQFGNGGQEQLLSKRIKLRKFNWWTGESLNLWNSLSFQITAICNLSIFRYAYSANKKLLHFWNRLTNKRLIHVIHVDGVRLHLWTAPPDIWVWRASMKWYWHRQTKELKRKNLSQCHIGHNISHMDWLGQETRPPWWQASD